MLSRFSRHSQSLASSPRVYLLFTRHASTAAPRRIFHRTRTIARYTGYLSLSSIFGVFLLGSGILIHDAFTYSDKHMDRVPVSPLALHPERGGPKNLPIVRMQVDDEEDDENVKLFHKPKLVVLGGGWGVSIFFRPPLCTQRYA